MKPKIKSIETSCRVWSEGDRHMFVSFTRWTGNTVTKPPDYSTSGFYHPTPASIARCRRAQDKAAGAGVDIFSSPVHPLPENIQWALNSGDGVYRP